MIDSLEESKRIPRSAGYWKVLAISLVYCAAFSLVATGTWMYGVGLDQPAWFQIVLAVVAIGMPFVVLIWGAVLASRQIRQRTGYPSSPEGLILVLLAASIAAGLISLPFEISAEYFVIVSLPFVVWIYLAILQRRFGPLSAVREREPRVRSA